MNEFSLFTALLIGIAGGVHCAGMCGGIVGSFTFMLPKDETKWPYMLAYNVGRIISYSLAGGLAGFFGQSLTSGNVFNPQTLPLLAGVFLALLGLYVGQWWTVLTHLEKAGSIIWRHISPLSKKFIPFKHPISAIPYGMIWGWLPCGLVYSTLTWSIASGSAVNGMLTMLFFGIGTLPIMLAMGATANTLRVWMRDSRVRKTIAVLMLSYGLILVYQAINNW
ncbi:sulfite exporter TauE/SafE family protein [Aliiglaciecola sp. M165]|uniref:sulfite exporter TauE/SafE family protein n=1 Tax=Aliiglaciecola sp. M165 TaxID=2593649 RepID=UPI00117CC17D|nr:sulfite exporter TauE/SafE family protein [Aliiglaciecola sp. M165]TRY30115.1 sulfite exporter TauE/SafE family protein [Aliiglaciecola sp. M165]